MAVGFSTQGGPFKPCCSPPFRLSSSLRRSSSATATAPMPSHASSPGISKGSQRKEIRSLHSADDPGSAIASFDSPRLRQGSGVMNRPTLVKSLGISSIGDADYCCSLSNLLNFKGHEGLRSSASNGHIIPLTSNYTISKGKYFPVLSFRWVDDKNRASLQQQIVAGVGAIPPCRIIDDGIACRTSLSDTYEPTSESSWLEESKKIKEFRLNQQVRQNATSLCSQRFDNIAGKDTVQGSPSRQYIGYGVSHPQRTRDLTQERGSVWQIANHVNDGELSPAKVGNNAYLGNRVVNGHSSHLTSSFNRVDVRGNKPPPIAANNICHGRMNGSTIVDDPQDTNSLVAEIARKGVHSSGAPLQKSLVESKVDLLELAAVRTADTFEVEGILDGELAVHQVSRDGESTITEDSNDTHIEKINPGKELRERLLRVYGRVLVVDNMLTAKRVVEELTTKYKHLVHACDTEVARIDVKAETPVGHGEIICFSIYSGPDADFGNGKNCIWVDVLDGGQGLLMEFASFFKDPSIKKVWHNYSFDCHIIENYGFEVSGFHADTMHLARLWDSSRKTEGGYSLEALTGDPKVMSGAQPCNEGEDISGKISMKSISGKKKLMKDGTEGGYSLEALTGHPKVMSRAQPYNEGEDIAGKISMKSVFGKKKLKKDGTEGKIITIAPVEELQREDRIPWICYSALDSMSTLRLFESLKAKLECMAWFLDGVERGTMYDFYEEYWRPFGELLVKMEADGMLVDCAYLSEIEKVAIMEQHVAVDRFRKWASKYCPDAKYMNVGSDAQLRQLFFGGITNRKDPNETLPMVKAFKVPNVDKVIEEGKKAPTKFRNIKLCSIGVKMQTDMYTASGWPSVSGDVLKMFAGKVSADYDSMDNIESDEHGEILSDLDEVKEGGNNPSGNEHNVDESAYGTAFTAFGGDKEGREACHAIAALCEVCSIDSLISNFILPLQGSQISGKNGRVHCSLNINTETGRLSARRPNLQNQPALEKDRYKIRQAFIAEPGNSLIVADYGQLELRILAHLANCESMLNAFKAGGDFHSRTAMNMYPHIREAVEEKRVLLEWDPQPGEEKSPVPLLKDSFASERRKAKMLNFSIAYGKTPVGLARDWKVSVKEAKETVELWYKERKEVLQWQEKRKEQALKEQCVYTLLGRARRFPSLAYASNSQRGHIERAAINTPVQGSAADVAMCAMLEISRNARLKELGWRLILQVHDEVILEGPTESAEIARAIVVECMSKPFYGTNFLNVDLAVDAKCAQNWYAAK